MKSGRPTRQPSGWVAVVCALATVVGGCTVSLVDGVSRSSGFTGAVNVPRAGAGPSEEVPIRGHHVTVHRVDKDPVEGELLAAGEDDMLVYSDVHGRVRIDFSDVRSIMIELAPPQAGTMALISLGLMVIGILGLATLNTGSAPSAFLAGWGVVWIPLGLFVALPSSAVIAAAGDTYLKSADVGLHALRPHLFEFARYPQGEPGRVSKPASPKPEPVGASKRAPSGTTPPAKAPAAPAPPPAPAPLPPIETIPSVAPPADAPPAVAPPPKQKPAPAPPRQPEQPDDSSEPSVVPYSPDRPPPPTR